MDVTLEDLEGAGLYDPASPHADERLELLEWLVDEQGFTIEELQDAARDDALLTVAVDRALRGGAKYSVHDLVELTGRDRDRVEATLRATRPRMFDEDELLFTDNDVEALRMAMDAEQLFPTEALLRFGRTLSASMARIADAANSLFLADVETDLVEHGSELELAQASLRALALLERLPVSLESMLRHWLMYTIEMSRRARGGMERESGRDLARLAVGFVDLTGYTSASQGLEPDELARLVDRFEAVASDATAGRGGRIVKLVGDEVMYVSTTAAEGVATARQLLVAFADDPNVKAHGGLAFGEVLARGGDYYGPVVNLAARLSEVAVPGEVLVTCEIADEVDGLEPAGRRMLKGFDEPVRLFSLTLG